MDPLERIQMLCTRSICGWSDDDFRAAAREGKRLWQQTEELFEIEYGMFWDAVAVIEPTFQLNAKEESAAEAVVQEMNSDRARRGLVPEVGVLLTHPRASKPV